jgi:hypothetical protein
MQPLVLTPAPNPSWKGQGKLQRTCSAHIPATAAKDANILERLVSLLFQKEARTSHHRNLSCRRGDYLSMRPKSKLFQRSLQLFSRFLGKAIGSAASPPRGSGFVWSCQRDRSQSTVHWKYSVLSRNIGLTNQNTRKAISTSSNITVTVTWTTTRMSPLPNKLTNMGMFSAI